MDANSPKSDQTIKQPGVPVQNPNSDDALQPLSGAAGTYQPVSDQAIPSVPQSPPAPLGKEYEPGQSMQEYAKLPGPELEPQLSPELEKAGIETVGNHEQPKLTIEDKRAGLAHGTDALTHANVPTNPYQLPVTKEEAVAVATDRKRKVWDSFKWFMANMVRQYDKKEEVKQH